MMETVQIETPTLSPPSPMISSSSLALAAAPKLEISPLPEIPSSASGVVHLVKEKVFTQISKEEQKECHRWVLNTGATNHMT
jgi:hypothetical protein